MVDGSIIDQGGPSNAVFAQLWGALATRYATKSRVIFGIMNKPWDGQ
jgi:endoglucanase